MFSEYRCHTCARVLLFGIQKSNNRIYIYICDCHTLCHIHMYTVVEGANLDIGSS